MGYTDITGIFRQAGDVNAQLTIAQLKTTNPDPKLDSGRRVQVSDGRIFVYSQTSALTGDDLFVVTPANSTGRFLLAPGPQKIPLPIAFGTADAAVLGTLPTGCNIRVQRCYWEVTTGFTGGSASAIGLSSNNTAHNTKGDLHGGAAGDVAATLVPGTAIAGTIGANIAAGVILVPTNTLRFDRITSAFTAGAGTLHVLADVLTNPGA